MSLGACCTFVPPYLLERIAASSSDAADTCRATLARDELVRAGRATTAATRPTPAATAAAAWVVHTARNGSTLPGDVVRSAGDPASGDQSVDEAASGVTDTLALYLDAFSRSSYDGKGAQVVVTVHYEQDYDNAFWDGTQLVFGDGDGKVFGSFTRPVDVLGHEFTHAVTQFTAGLTYQGQSGALNESLSDCFGMCVKQQVARPDRRHRRLAGRAGHLPAGHQGAGPARHGPPRHRLRRPDPGQGPSGRRHVGLRRHHRRQRRGPHQLRHPQPRLLPRRDRHRRRDLGGRGPDLVRRTDRRSGHRRHRLRRLRGGHGRGGRRPRRRRPRRPGRRSGSTWPGRRPARPPPLRRLPGSSGCAVPGGSPARTLEGTVDLGEDSSRGRAGARAPRPGRPRRAGRAGGDPTPTPSATPSRSTTAALTVPQHALSADQRALADLVLGRRAGPVPCVRASESAARQRSVREHPERMRVRRGRGRGRRSRAGWCRDRPAARRRPA